MDRLTISIALCTYNGEKYLRDQLESIARQTRLPDELIICDDNSLDGTIRIIQKFTAAVHFPVVLFRNSTNIGSTKNFEQAIQLCKGDIIALCDQDDVWNEDKLALIEKEFIRSESVGVVFSNGNIVDDKLRPLGYTLWDTYRFKDKDKRKFRAGSAFQVLVRRPILTGATLAFRSYLVKCITPIPPIFVHDAWIAIICSMLTRIEFINQSLIEYRQHLNQQIGGKKQNALERAKSVFDYDIQIEQTKNIFLHASKLQLVNNNYILRLLDKISHLEARNKICSASSLGKIRNVLFELVTMRYHKYSNGLLSVFKDVFFKKLID